MSIITRSLQCVVRMRRLSGIILGYKEVINHAMVHTTAKMVQWRGMARHVQMPRYARYPDLCKLLEDVENKIQTIGFAPRAMIAEIMRNIDSYESVPVSESIRLLEYCIDYIQDCSPSMRVRIAKNIWIRFETHDIPLQLSHYNTLLQIYLHNGHKFSPIQFLLELQNKGIKPDVRTYTTLLECSCQYGDMNTAKKLLSSMELEQYPLTEHIYYVLVVGYSEAGDFKNALETIEVMQRISLRPTVLTYAGFLRMYTKANNLQKVQETLISFEEDFKLPNEIIFDMIYNLIMNNHTDYAIEMFYKVRVNYELRDLLNLTGKLIDAKQYDLALMLTLRASINNPEWNRKCIRIHLDSVIFHMDTDVIIDLCNYLHSTNLYPFALFRALAITVTTYQKEVTEKLLKACIRQNYPIRAKCFWPILMHENSKSNLHGMLQTLQSMTEEYNVMPCLETLSQHVVQFMPGSPDEKYNMLKKLNINSGIIHNSIVYNMLKKLDLQNAAAYVRHHKHTYWAMHLQNVLWEAFNYARDVNSFLNIALQLYEPRSAAFTSRKEDVLPTSVLPVSIEDLLFRFMASYAVSKGFMTNIVHGLKIQNICLSGNGVDNILQVLGDEITLQTLDILNEMKLLYKSTLEIQLSWINNAKWLIGQDRYEDALILLEQNAAVVRTKDLHESSMAVLMTASPRLSVSRMMQLFNVLESNSFMRITGINDLVEVYIKRGHYRDAVGILCSFTEVYKDVPDVTWELAKILLEQKKHQFLVNLLDCHYLVTRNSRSFINALASCVKYVHPGEAHKPLKKPGNESNEAILAALCKYLAKDDVRNVAR